MITRCSECNKAIKKPLGRHAFKKNTKDDHICYNCFHDCIAKRDLDFDLMETYRMHMIDMINNNYYKDKNGHVIKEVKE